jgi:hypothetical protein
LLLALTWTAAVQARSVDVSPHVAILLPKSQRFLARDNWSSVTLYTYEGNAVRRFNATETIFDIDASLDERTLLIVHYGGVGVWDIDTGQRLWSKSFQDARGFGATLSPDGRFVGVCWGGLQGVFDARTGDRIGAPLLENAIHSVVVVPGGAQAIGSSLRGQLFTVDTASGRITPPALKGYLVAYAIDGQRAAVRDTSGQHEKLCIVSIGDLSTTELGDYYQIGLIRPASNGGFLVTASTRDHDGEQARMNVIGAIFDPTSGKLTETWRLPPGRDDQRMHYDPDTMVGVSTSYRFVTELIDLRTGDVRLKIDNSDNYEGIGLSWRWTIVGLVVVALLGGWILIGRRRSVFRG